MKKKDPVEIVAECAEKIVERNRRFHDLIENGGSDPTWSDGANLGLVRNHIMYYKEQILKLCSENGILLPDEYYIPTPPEVDPFFMAKKDERFKKLNSACFYNGKLHNRKPELQEREQLTFF